MYKGQKCGKHWLIFYDLDSMTFQDLHVL